MLCSNIGKFFLQFGLSVSSDCSDCPDHLVQQGKYTLCDRFVFKDVSIKYVPSYLSVIIVRGLKSNANSNKNNCISSNLYLVINLHS